MTATSEISRPPSRFYPFDRLIMGYCAAMLLLIMLLGRPLAAYYDEAVFYATAIILVVLMARFADEQKSRRWALVRLVYPVLLFTFFYRNTGGLMFIVFDHFFDGQLTAFELSLLGVNPTLYIDQRLLSVWANEIFSFFYFSYYLMIPIFVLALYVRKEYQLLKSFLTACCLTFFLSYILFFLYPIEGPRWYFAGQYMNRIEGPLFRDMVNLVIDKAAVHGGCMPSSHVAVALVIMMYCLKRFARIGWLLLPVNIGLAIGTVWGRFHYVSDVIVGSVIGLVVTLLVWRFYPGWGCPSGSNQKHTVWEIEHA
ncbi:MAG: phosphatase PAP2 family protein [bacterium]